MPKPFSPLALDKETAKKYGITKEIDPTPAQKVVFLQNQLLELKSMQWRARVDVVHAKRLAESDNDVLKNKGLTNLSQHQNEVQQSTGAILMLEQFIKELRAEYVELQVEE